MNWQGAIVNNSSFKLKAKAVALAAVIMAAAGGYALAADMPTKAPPMAPAPPPSNWHAFLEVGYNFGQMNPQGQAVYKGGDYNFVGGAILDLYSSKTGFINGWSAGVLGIADFSSGTLGPATSLYATDNEGGQGLYYILSANTAVTFNQYWTLKEEFFHLSGDNANGNFPVPANCGGGATTGCLDTPAWNWNQVTLSLNDGAVTKWPISFNPYVTWFYSIYPSGNAGVLGTTTSSACFSCNEEGSDFILGIAPKVSLQPYLGLPVSLAAPTWFTVGPKSFWAGNAGAGPGSGCVAILVPGTNCSTSNIGTVTTGLTASMPLTSIAPQYGHWSVKGGFQWFDLVNKALQSDALPTYGVAYGLHQYITVGFLGLGVGF
jgi:hypothetical protein